MSKIKSLSFHEMLEKIRNETKIISEIIYGGTFISKNYKDIEATVRDSKKDEKEYGEEIDLRFEYTMYLFKSQDPTINELRRAVLNTITFNLIYAEKRFKNNELMEAWSFLSEANFQLGRITGADEMRLIAERGAIKGRAATRKAAARWEKDKEPVKLKILEILGLIISKRTTSLADTQVKMITPFDGIAEALNLIEPQFLNYIEEKKMPYSWTRARGYIKEWLEEDAEFREKFMEHIGPKKKAPRKTKLYAGSTYTPPPGFD